MVKTSNRNARASVQARNVFDASNTFGRIVGPLYVVYSYGVHWPLFVYEGGVWYENEDRYSVTTSKHRSQLHPLLETEPRSVTWLKNRIREVGNL